MSDKYIDQTGLARILTNLKANFATKSIATTSADGLMSAADKTKLDGLSSGGGGGSVEALTDAEVLAILEASS